MEDTKTVDTQTTVETTTTNEGLLTQEQFDNALNSRLARAKDGIAKELGLESYSSEAIESYVAKSKEAFSTIESLNQEKQNLTQTLQDKDFTLEALKLGVTNDNVARAVKLAKVELESNSELDANKSLELVLQDFPFLAKGEDKKTVTKVGAEVNNQQSTKNEVDEYLNSKYSNSRYFNKK